MTDFFYPAATVPTPASITRRLVSNGAVLRSALSFGTQTIVRAGEHWELEVGWSNVSGDALRDLIATLERVNGTEHRLVFHAFDWTANRGAWTGSPVVDGASQSGSTLNIRGAAGSVTDWALPGDFFYMVHGDRYELRRVVAPADTSVGGDATLEIMPRLRSAPADGEPLIIAPNMYGKYIVVNPIETQMNAPAGRGATDRVSNLRVQLIEDVVG